MTMTDPVADFLTRIRNAQMASKPWTDIPVSKLKIRLNYPILRFMDFSINLETFSFEGEENEEKKNSHGLWKEDPRQDHHCHCGDDIEANSDP